ncbi:MAG: diguanylate cyclase [Coriobacteriia bacterium]|nr:diguanylate cyclase [Coriobacteriia bacterium]
MKEVLSLCAELDRTTYATYKALARAFSSDPELSEYFHQLAADERKHVHWWSELLAAWKADLLPKLKNADQALERLKEIKATLSPALCEDYSHLSVDDALDLAAQFEFFMLDPLFGELMDFIQPGDEISLTHSYPNHILRLIELIEKRYSRPGMARFLAGVLERTLESQQQLSALALRDELTSLYNRRGILSHLDQWLSWSVRYNRPLGVILLDVDNLKVVNDTHGHEAGDYVLKNVAEVLTETIRATDMVGRFGGDEFVVLAPETESEALDSLAERLITAVADRPVITASDAIGISISAGGASLPSSSAASAEKLLAEADSAMYLHKTEKRAATQS